VVILDTALQFAGFFAEAVIIGLLLFRHIYKKLPLFSAYLIWSFISDFGGYLLIHRFPGAGLHIYFASIILDAIFMFCVLIEVSMSVLKPISSLLPRWAIGAVTLIVALCGVAVWQFIRFRGLEGLPAEYQNLVHMQMTLSAVRILFFLLLACLSQLLSIGWRDRELQIATGFGFYALVSLSVALLHLNQGLGTSEQSHQYHLVDFLGGASYVCALFYWIVCFVQDVPERREFTPQMQNFLLAVAGNARSTRMAMRDSSKSDSDHPLHR
jgi:hypothetical protein